MKHRDLTVGYQYLMQIKWKDSAIQYTQMRIDALRSCLMPKAITYDKDKVQTSPADQMSEVMATIDDLERDIMQMQLEKSKLIGEIGATISLLPDEAERKVLFGFYLSNYRMSKIARIVGYNLQHLYKVRARAVDHLMDFLPESGEECE